MRLSTALPALALALLALPVLASCSDPSGPGPTPGSELVFLRNAPGAPPLATDQVSRWIKVDDGGEIEIPYANGEDCLEFRVPGDALQRLPNGTRLAEDDSVLITVRVVNAGEFNFEFSPSGLQFDADRPAELRVSYKYADRDYDGDGDQDDDDDDVERRFRLWRQATDGAPWVPIGTVRDASLERVRAELRGFSKYALAGG